MAFSAKTMLLNRIRKRPLIVHAQRAHLPCRFLELPQELKDMIYELLLKVDGRIGLLKQTSFNPKFRLPCNALLATNKQINMECMRVVYSHPILIASINPMFESNRMKLCIPKAVVDNVRFLTIQISAPELKMQENMTVLRNSLLGACMLQKLEIEIYPYRATVIAAEILVGSNGRHVLREGLAYLEDIKIRGDVTIRLATGHLFGPTLKSARRNKRECKNIVRDMAERMVLNGSKLEKRHSI